ncbi:hypothetical protein DPMN_181219 [Dreissena polymorpha]|uniref:Uncharacterized protein n=1 Tax=Dreissena polymorpha TaxID=45954 RepID=A0A9D4DDR9_DREPO|nr:hypothetical protein DPMN_181219 [Dreissena polymorpha]
MQKSKAQQKSNDDKTVRPSAPLSVNGSVLIKFGKKSGKFRESYYFTVTAATQYKRPTKARIAEIDPAITRLTIQLQAIRHEQDD